MVFVREKKARGQRIPRKSCDRWQGERQRPRKGKVYLGEKDFFVVKGAKVDGGAKRVSMPEKGWLVMGRR